MNNPQKLTIAFLAWIIGVSPLSFGQTSAAKIHPADLRSVPNGNYLVTLEVDGQVKRLNLKVEGDQAKCVNSSDPSLKDIQGQFQSRGNGSFMAFLQGAKFRGSQLWIFRKDGAAAIREVPDRGEQQSAVPVSSDSIEPPKKK